MTSWLADFDPSSTSAAGALGAVARATAIWLLAWAATRGWARSASAAARHRIWVWASVGVLAAPLLGAVAPGWRLTLLPDLAPAPARPPAATGDPVRPARADRPIPTALAPGAPIPIAASPSPRPARIAASPPAADPDPRPRSTRHEPGSARRWSAVPALALIWVVGFAAVLVPTVGATIRAARRGSRRVADPAWLALLAATRGELGVARRVDLRRGDGAIPVTRGVFRPAILLPEAAEGWPASTRRLVLLHELAHVARRDVAALLLGRAAAAAYWFHPLAWLALARLRIECEHAADDAVIAAGAPPSTYAGQLLALARAARARPSPPGLAMARPRTLEQRMVALFDESRSHAPLPPRAASRLAGVALALILATGTARPGPARPGSASAPASTSALSVPVDPPPGPAQSPPAEVAGRIEGRLVRDADGGAVAAAKVNLVGPPPRGRTIPDHALFPRTVETDPDGRFAFADLMPGDYQVWATVGDLTTRTRMIGQPVAIPAAGPAVRVVDLRLRPGASLRARVLDAATGRPLPGATVHFRWGGFGPEFAADADGRVVARPLPVQAWDVEVWAEGHAKLRRRINFESRREEEAEFRLAPGGGLAGVVRDATGKPLAGVGIGATIPATHEQLEWAEADKEGRYRFAHLPAGANLRLGVNEMDYKPFERLVTIAPGQLDLDLTLEPRPDGGAVAGIVRDARGRPVVGADVSNMGDSSDHVRRTTTGPDGRYRLANLFRGATTGTAIYVRAPGLAARRVEVTPGPADAPTPVDVTLDPGHRVHARAVDDRGTPLEGVAIYPDNAEVRRYTGERYTTGPDGVFRVDSLPAREVAPTRLRLVKQDYSEVSDREVPLDTAEPVDIRLAEGGVIVGHVVDAATGRAIPAFNVRVTFSHHRGPDEPSGGLSSALVRDGLSFRSPVGRFRMKDLVAGMTLQVTVAAPGYENRVVDPVAVRRASDLGVAEFALAPVDPASLVRYAGRLRDPAGKPVAAAEVRLIAREQPAAGEAPGPIPSWHVIRDGQIIDYPGVVRFLRATTDAEGGFGFDAVPARAQVTLAWWGAGVGPALRPGLEQVAPADRAGLDLRAAPPARLAVTVDRRKYPTGEQVEISTRGQGPHDYASRPVPADGAEVLIEGLAAGEYQVTLTPAFRPDPARPNGLISPPTLATVAVKLVPGSTTRVDLGKGE